MANPRIKQKYLNDIVPAMKEKFQYSSVMQVPKLSKIVLNKGIGAAVADKKLVDQGVEELSLITGQRAVSTKAKTSVSNFKLREGMPIGAKVTLRGDKMYEFLDRLMTVALPRVRDFKGISDKGFDGRGNYTLGVTEQIIFGDPEITTGASNDLQQVTNIARQMVTRYGMSNIGPIALEDDNNEQMFLGGESNDAIADRIDTEVCKIINHCEKIATEIILDNRVVIDLAVEKLLDAETIDGSEFRKLVKEYTVLPQKA